MVKKTALLLFILACLMATPCYAMQMAAQSMQTQDENAAKGLIQQLLGKKHAEIIHEVGKLSKENKEFIKNVLHKNHFLFAPQVRLQQILSGLALTLTIAIFSTNGLFALTTATNDVQLWDLTKSPITSQKLKGHTDWIKSVAFSPDSRFAMTGSWDRTARLWNLTKSPITCQELKGHAKALSSVAFSPNGNFALTGSYDDAAQLWDLTQSPITCQELKGHTNPVTSVAFSPDGRFVLTGSCDKTAMLWDLTKSPIVSERLADHTNRISSVAFSPNGNFALTGSQDKTARLWDLTKSPITCLKLAGHTDWVSPIAFSPNGRFALTGSYDATARLWNLNSSPITYQELKGHTRGVTSVAFSPDGNFILTGSSDDTTRLWKIESIDIKVVSLDDSLLLLKLIENEDSLQDDSLALDRLPLIMKEPHQPPLVIKLIADYLYRTTLPAHACYICTEKYDTESHICMQLPCCKQCICKACLERIGSMTYASEFEEYTFDGAVQKKCPYCNKHTDQMGPLKTFGAYKNNNKRKNHG